jgi:hypothetical protein
MGEEEWEAGSTDGEGEEGEAYEDAEVAYEGEDPHFGIGRGEDIGLSRRMNSFINFHMCRMDTFKA